MSKLDFSKQEFDSRRAAAASAITNAGLDWLIAFHPVSIHWLTGSEAKSYQEFQCLFVPAAEGPLRVLTRESDRLEFEQDAWVDELCGWGGPEPEDPIDAFELSVRQLGLNGKRVGIEVPSYYLHPHDYLRIKSVLGDALVAEPTMLLHNLKLIKSPAEIDYIREAARIADEAMVTFVKALEPGRSELSVAGEVYRAMMDSGSGIAASPINLVSGNRSCFSHGAPTQKPLERGDFGNVEYGATWCRYTSTIGRQFVIGRPTTRMRELYHVARAAADACIAVIADGVPAVEPHLAAKRVIAEAGLDAARVHTSGYGLAPSFPPTWGEPLHMFGDSSYTLRSGMVITVEPPVFVGSEGLGARLIDNVLITPEGPELLSRFSRDLIVVE